MSTQNWWVNPAVPPSAAMELAATERQGQLTKPPGALGRLEHIAIALAAIQGQLKPQLEQIFIAVFAGDHGIVEEGISAFPQAVTVNKEELFPNCPSDVYTAKNVIVSLRYDIIKVVVELPRISRHRKIQSSE